MSEETDLMSDRRPIRYIETLDDGTERVIYRASSVGTCERALVAAARKVMAQPYPDWFRDVLDEGTLNESVISDMWDVETQIPTVDQQRELNLLIGEIDGRDVYVRCHVDGVNGADPTSIREYKKFRDSTWPKFLESGVECNQNYPWQVSIAMHALEQEYPERRLAAVEFVGGHYAGTDETGRVITEVHCKYLASPPIPLIAIRKKIARIERLINQGFDVMEVSCDLRQYPCPYYRYHDVVADKPVVVVEPDEQLSNLLVAYRTGKVLAAERRQVLAKTDNDLKKLRTDIIDQLVIAGIKPGCELHVGNDKLLWSETPKDGYEVRATTVVKLDFKKDKLTKKEEDKAS